MHAPLLNSKDPLGKVSPTNEREALVEIAGILERAGANVGFVNNVAANLIVNGFRQAYPTRAEAERAFDELAAKTKSILMDQYTTEGRRRGVFAYDQVIQVPHVDLRQPQG